MPMADVDLGYAIGLPPADAIAYFESKGYTLGFNWHDVEARTHATAFTVAGVLKQDVLQDIRSALSDALGNGGTLDAFRRQLVPTLTNKGWLGRGLVADEDGVLEGKQLTPSRLRTIFETNMQAAYGAGRYQQQMANAAARPFWERIGIMDTHIRPAHARLNGFTARYDDPVWQFTYPPDGYHCRCRIRTHSAADVERQKLIVQSSEGRIERVQQAWGPNDTREVLAFRNPIDNQLYTPDAGFGHNPGQGYLAALGQRLMDRSTTAPARLGSLAISETLREPALVDALNREIGKFVDQVMLRGTAANDLRHVGGVSPASLAHLEASGISPASAVLSITDADVLAAPGPVWATLPSQLRTPSAVVRDGDALVYILNHKAGLSAVRATASTPAVGWRLMLVDQGRALSDAELSALHQMPLVEGNWNGR